MSQDEVEKFADEATNKIWDLAIKLRDRNYKDKLKTTYRRDHDGAEQACKIVNALKKKYLSDRDASENGRKARTDQNITKDAE